MCWRGFRFRIVDTATVALFVGSTLYLANVGDSRAVLAEVVTVPNAAPGAAPQLHAQALRMSIEHKPGNGGEGQRLSEADAKVKKGRVIAGSHSVNMSRALGDFDFKQPANEAPADWISPAPHVTRIELTPAHQFLVLASDGLWDFFDDTEVVNIIATNRSRGASVQRITEALVENISQAPGSDNVTVIALCLEWGDEGETGQALLPKSV